MNFLKRWRRNIALLLVTCMVFSTPLSEKAHAEGEEITRFVATDNLNWDTYPPTVNTDAVYGKELGCSLATNTVSFGYRSVSDGDITMVDSADISVSYGDADGSQLVEFVKNEGYEDGLYDVYFQQTGTYTLFYNQSPVTVNVRYPEVGFYKDASMTDANYIREFCFSNWGQNSFYIMFNPFDGNTITLDNSTPFYIFDWDMSAPIEGAEIDNYISCEPVTDNPNAYKITVNTDRGFEFRVNTICTPEEGEAWPLEMGMGVWYEEKMEGLVLKDWIEYNPETDSLYVHEDAEYSKETWPEMTGTTLYMAYLESEEDETPEVLTVSDLTVTYNGEDATGYYDLTVNQQNTSLLDFKFSETGDYTISYTRDSVTSSVTLHVGYPIIGFYKTAELTTEGYISDTFHFTGGNQDAIYMIIDKRGGEVTSSGVEVLRYYSDSIAAEVVSDTAELQIHKITITDERCSDFYILGSGNISWEGQEPQYIASEIHLADVNTRGRIGYTDGEAHVGFVGTYITKEEFEAGSIFWGNNEPAFWAHADTVQGVIDKLSAAANGELILYEKVDFSGPILDSTTEDVEIVNTGYIYISVSTHGNVHLEEQYVSSSGNMKGILFVSGKDTYYSVHEKENGFYIEDIIYNLDKFRAKLQGQGIDPATVIPADLQDETYVSCYKGKFYHTVKVEEDGLTYFTMDTDDAVVFAANENGMEAYLYEHLRTPDVAEMTPFYQYPEMHVNIYCDMKFTGRYEKLSVGFKEGKDFTATIYNQIAWEENANYTIADLGDADTKEVSTRIGYPTEENDFAEEDITVWLYRIDSETTNSGGYEGEVTVAETPEPNAMPELTQAQKDAIEQSKKLTVDLKAEEQQEEKIDSDVADAVKGAINDEEYSGVVYVDLSVYAKVEGVENDGKPIETQITELKTPMDITIDIPEHALKDGRKFKVVRHHVGKDGKKKTEVIDAHLSHDKKKISFKTHKFSTYAIVYDSVDEEITDTPTYQIIAGAGEVWTIGADGGMSIKGDGNYADFKEIKVDGVVVDKGNYTVTEGSTVITLSKAYLDTLSAGNHTFEMVWTDGSATTTFEVKKSEAPPANNPDNNTNGNTNNNINNNTSNNTNNNASSSSPADATPHTLNKVPNTGDSHGAPIWIVFALVCGVGILYFESKFFRKEK